MVTLSLEAGQLAVLVLNALHGLLVFYQRDARELNVDSLFGLRILQGQLDAIRHHLPPGTAPPRILKEMRRLSRQADEIAKASAPYVRADDPDYYDNFRLITDVPYTVWGERRLTAASLLWPGQEYQTKEQKEKKNFFNETRSDECMTELLRATSLRASTGSSDSCPGLSQDCKRMMLEERGFGGYYITHQILYTAIADVVNCTHAIDAHVRTAMKRFHHSGLKGWREEWCSNLYEEMGGGERDWVVPDNKDLFMEQIMVCGQFGFYEFAQLKWLDAILSWQGGDGCFPLPGQPLPRKPKKEELEQRFLFEKITSDGCGGHVNAVAVGALTIFLRFLIVPGDLTMGNTPFYPFHPMPKAKPWPFLKIHPASWFLTAPQTSWSLAVTI